MPRRTKGQHFLLSAAARTLSLAAVLGMTDREAETVFAAIRWADSDGRPACPDCGCNSCYDCRRPNGAPRWRCKACHRDFSPTSGTLFAFHKLALRIYLAAIVIFLNEVKGKSALALSRDLDVQYKTAFVLAHKIREAMASEAKGIHLGGAGRAVEVDGAYFGGHVRPENRKEDRLDRRLAENQTGKRQCVVVVRERASDGSSLGRTIGQRLQERRRGAGFHQGPCRSRQHRPCRRGRRLERAARALRDQTRQPLRRIRQRRGLHQSGGELLQPHPPGRDRPSPPHLRPVPQPLRQGGGVARGSPPRQQRPAVPCHHLAGRRQPSQRRLLRLLAAEPGGIATSSSRSIGDPPRQRLTIRRRRDHAVHGTLQHAVHRLLDQLARAVIGRIEAAVSHQRLGDLA